MFLTLRACHTKARISLCLHQHSSVSLILFASLQVTNTVTRWIPVAKPTLGLTVLAEMEEQQYSIIHIPEDLQSVSKFLLPKEVTAVAGLSWEEEQGSLKFISLNQEGKVAVGLFGQKKPRSKLLGALCDKCGTMLYGN